MSADRNSWATPPELFAELHAQHQFTVDACASEWNAKLPRYWDEAEDGLAQNWRGETVWCNPPYGKGLILPWVKKALNKVEGHYGVVLLLPSRTDTEWFQMLLAAGAHIEFLPKRIRFIPPDGIKASSPTEASIIVMVRR